MPKRLKKLTYEVKHVESMIAKHIETHFSSLKQEVYKGYNGMEICRSGSTSARGHQSFSPFTRHGKTTESFVS